MTNEERDQKIQEMHQVLLGVDGTPGLCRDFMELSRSHYALKRAFYCLIAFLAGLGVITGITELITMML